MPNLSLQDETVANENVVMKPISRILIATDFSEASIALAPFARAFASHYSAETYVVHVAGTGIFPILPAKEKDRILKEAQSKMREFLQTAMVTDHDDKHLVCGGDAPQILCGLAQTLNIDLIVLGTNGRRGIGRFILGSVAEEIFRSVPCPVLTIGPKARGKMMPEIQLRWILFATDLEAPSLEALTYALALANDCQMALFVLHVAANDREAREARRRLGAVISKQHATGKVKLQIVTGSPASTILKVARNNQADLIVMGVRGGGEWSRLETHAPGPVAYSVVAQAPCPVLTIRSHDKSNEVSDGDAA